MDLVALEKTNLHNSAGATLQKAPKVLPLQCTTLTLQLGSGWWHWLVFDLPANTRELPANAGNIALKLSPTGSVQSVTDYGKPGYGGPCPPKGHGDHRYIITVYALKVKKLGLDAKTTPAMCGYYLNNNALAKASIIAYYKRD